MAVYYAPKPVDNPSDRKFTAEPGPYLCYKCNKQVIHKGYDKPLEPCKYCGSYIFWK